MSAPSTSASSFTFSLEEYFERIGYSRAARVTAVTPDLATLFAVHRAHASRIPFENLDIQMGRGISLDPEGLVQKLVRQRRGGYCFEHNSLFALALRAMGYDLDTCEARVRQQDHGKMRPRTHMTLVARCEGREWLADVGFGADGLIEPVPLDGSTVEQARASYRIVIEGKLRVLQHRMNGQAENAWEDLYAIMPDPAAPVDYEMGNWFTSTWPRSGFIVTLTAQRIIGDARHALRNLTYTITRGSDVEVRELRRDEVVPLLRETFGIDVSPDATFRALDSTPD